MYAGHHLIVPTVVALILPWTAIAPAQDETQIDEYQAIVDSASAPIHSGNSEDFYVTQILKNGDTVQVVRHDPGGWTMIRPPLDAFSLVPSNSIELREGRIAEVMLPNIKPRVGSEQTDQFTVEQIPLRTGTLVEVLKDKAAPENWTAIRSPRGEFRWIRESHLKSLSPEVSEAPVEPAPVANTPQPSQADAMTSSADPHKQLEGLDAKLEDSLRGMPDSWSLEAISVEYQRLKRSQLDLAYLIDLRLKRIAEIRNQQEIDPTAPVSIDLQLEPPTDSVSAPSTPAKPSTPERQTLRPDTDLAESASPLGSDSGSQLMQSVPPEMQTVPQRTPTPVTPQTDEPTLPEPAPTESNSVPARSSNKAVYQPNSTPSMAAIGEAPPTDQNPEAITSDPNDKSQRFDAVGYLQRAINPPSPLIQYVLISPEGRILAYLQFPTQSPLERYVGFPMGIDGAPHETGEATVPVIDVKRLTPVRF